MRVAYWKWVAVLWVTFFPWLTGAQEGVTIIKSPGKTNFAVTGFSGDASVGSRLADVLKNDLSWSGHFNIVPASDAQYIQQGNVKVVAGNGFVDCTVMLASSKKVVLQKTYQGSEQDLRRMVHQLSDDIVQLIAGQPGIAQTKIAFIVRKNNGKELAVMDYDGHNARQLTHDGKISAHPRWSPDGKKILYTSYLRVFPDILEVDLITTMRKVISRYPGLNSGAVYSPDGRYIAMILSKDGNPELYVTNADGGGMRRLTNTKGGESSPTWSPDGESIAYVSDDRGSPQIYVVSRSGGEPTRLTTSPAYNTEPDWSKPPAGSTQPPMLVVTSRVAGRFQIGFYNSSNREVIPLVADDADNQEPSWAPDGRHLVFTKMRNYKPRFYLLDVVTKEQVQLPSIEGEVSEPAWGP